MNAFFSKLKEYWLLIFALAIIANCYYFFARSTSDKICFGRACFLVEIADEEAEWKKGLMVRDSLLPDHGMLFIFDKERELSFWMEEMKFPLDMIFMDQNFRVIQIFENNQPCEGAACPIVKPEKRAKYVLEINAGLAMKKGISPGQRAEFK